MISQDLIKIITENADELTRRLLKDLLSRKETSSFRQIPPDLMYERVFDVYSKLDTWLEKGTSHGIIDYYIKLGHDRYDEGIPLHELILAFMLIKRHLWLYVQEQQLPDSAYHLNKALELNNKVVLYFDRIIYAVTLGYEQQIEKKIDSIEGGMFSKIFKKREQA